MQMRLGLGGCGKCMRSAFRAAAIAWLLTAACWQYGPSIAYEAALLISALLTMLWIAHLFAYSIRQSASAKVVSREQLVPGGRREVLSGFAHSFVAAAAVTALPALL